VTCPNSADTWLSYHLPCFILGWGVIAEGRVTALPIVEHLDILKNVLGGFVPFGGYTSSRLSVPKKLSTHTLSQQLPRLLMLGVRPCMVSTCSPGRTTPRPFRGGRMGPKRALHIYGYAPVSPSSRKEMTDYAVA
jgi:hypothetical protein